MSDDCSSRDFFAPPRLRPVTLAEHYGVPADKTVKDEEWLTVAGQRGWAVLMKDARIRHNPVERGALRSHRVRCFCISSQNITGAEQAERFLDNLEAITAACAAPGPFVYAVHRTRIERLHVPDADD